MGHHQVRLANAIKVRNRHLQRSATHGVDLLRLKRSVAIAQ